MKRMMKAVRIHKYGSPEQLVYEDVPVPEPHENEFLVRVHAVGVNPADRQIRAGLRHRLEEPFSLILGADISGVVEEIGHGITDFEVGDEVYGLLHAMGGYAEYVTDPAVGFAHKPESLDHVQAAALPVVGYTAWQALFETGKLSPGQRVLIHAAAGGVGHIAVQFAKWKGAYVIGTASARNKAFLHRLGVDEFINYQNTKFEDIAHDVDLVLDAIPREVDDATDALARETIERSWAVLKDNSILVSICTHPSPGAAAARGVRGLYVRAQPRRDQLDQISKLVDEGYVKPFVSTVLPLKEARRAHELIQTGNTHGKIVLRVKN